MKLSADRFLAAYAAGDRDFGQADLERVQLVGADIRDANLNGANFHAAKLNRTNFSDANLSMANLSNADLGHAILSANLSNANLRSAGLSNADLRHADLSGVNLRDADLSSADLRDANLSGAQLIGASLIGANLGRANLGRANLSGAFLIHADLARADLMSADLSDADLSDANLSGAALGRANLTRARLSGVKLSACRLSETILADLNIAAFCTNRGALVHHGRSRIDDTSIARSLHAPGLAEFLVDTGMPAVYVTYAIESLKSLSEADLFALIHSTLISHGGGDQDFAIRLRDALGTHGVQTWLFKDQAKPGDPLHQSVREGVDGHGRILLLCSADALQRPGVLSEVDLVLRREYREGGIPLLIPVLLDSFVLEGKWNPINHPSMGTTIRDRVCADFRDPADFDRQLLRLLDALKKVRPNANRAVG